MSGERQLRRVLRPVDGPANRVSSGFPRPRQAVVAVDAARSYAGGQEVC